MNHQQRPHPDRSWQREHPSTYVVQDRSNEEELLRVDEQDRMMTEVMGGVLPEVADPVRYQRILDVGCGTGGWLIETAKCYPLIRELVGVDISSHMIEHARVQAETAGLHNRVQFQTGDALRMLEFPTGSFQLINQRFGMSYLRTWDWPKLLQEYQRVCQVGCLIRITECAFVKTNSPALTRLTRLMICAFQQAGRLFSPESEGVIAHLAGLMEQYGIKQVQTCRYSIAFHQQSEEIKHAYVRDLHRAFRTTQPFLRKWTRVPTDYEEIYQQMVEETQQDDFEATQTLLTAWGTGRGNGYGHGGVT